MKPMEGGKRKPYARRWVNTRLMYMETALRGAVKNPAIMTMVDDPARIFGRE